MNIACVVTAAGLSRRFGGDKLAFPIAGKAMGIRCLELYASVPFAQRLLVTSENRLYLRKAAEALQYEVLLNPCPEEGVGISVALGTQAVLEHAPDGILYAVGDQPYLTPKSVLALLEAFEREPDCIWTLGSKGKRGKPSIFPKSCFVELMQMQGDSGGRPVIRAHPDLLCMVEVDEKELMDLDIREELL